MGKKQKKKKKKKKKKKNPKIGFFGVCKKFSLMMFFLVVHNAALLSLWYCENPILKKSGSWVISENN